MKKSAKFLLTLQLSRITSGECQARCRVTTDKTRLNQSQAVVFHMPDLHWEGYNYPKYRSWYRGMVVVVEGKLVVVSMHVMLLQVMGW